MWLLLGVEVNIRVVAAAAGVSDVIVIGSMLPTRRLLCRPTTEAFSA
jgi:hypothetical protein